MNEKIHRMVLENRELLSVTAVDDIIGFDETQVSLSVGGAVFSVSGSGLSLRKLSLETGEVVIAGHIDAAVYLDSGTGKKKRSRLFG